VRLDINEWSHNGPIAGGTTCSTKKNFPITGNTIDRTNIKSC